MTDKILSGGGAVVPEQDAGTVRFARKGEFVTRSIAGDTILVPVRGQVGDLNAIYNLNEQGTFIWERLDGRTTVGEIAAALTDEFEVEAAEAEADAMNYLRELEAAGIVEPRAGDCPA